MDHSELCVIAARWLKASKQSKRGAACQVAFIEPRISFMGGESPDAIGFRISSGIDGGSTVVECKVSRSDFLADRKKPHRTSGGMGKWRYMLCPEGLIDPHELLPGWGLLYVGNRKKVKPVLGPASFKNSWGEEYEKSLQDFSHEHDAFRETLMLGNLLHRIGDAEALNTRLRNAEGANQRLVRDLNRKDEQLRELEREKWTKKLQLEAVMP